MLQLQHCLVHWKSAAMLGYAKKIATLKSNIVIIVKPFEIDKSLS
jgi:hypothetical protein